MNVKGVPEVSIRSPKQLCVIELLQHSVAQDKHFAGDEDVKAFFSRDGSLVSGSRTGELLGFTLLAAKND